MKAPINRGVIETVKTIVIAVLVTAIVAFVGGVKYEQFNTGRIDSAVKAVAAAKPSKD
jgi:hypothetical protein